MGLRPMEILLIFAALLLLFGGTRLPQLGSALGSAIRNFRKGFTGESEPAADDKKAPTALASSTGADKDVNARSTTHQG